MKNITITGAVDTTCAQTRVTRERQAVTHLLRVTAPVSTPVWGSTLPIAAPTTAFGPAAMGYARTLDNSMDVAPPFRTGRPPA